MFKGRWNFNGKVGTSPERDPGLEEALRALDPAAARPQYWLEFRRAVLFAAAPELARRRRTAEITISDVVFSWSRTLVPAAMVAAAAAVLLVLRPDTASGPLPLRLEQMIWEGVDLSAGDPRAALEVEVSFAAEIF
jgi:hypothetical protein